MPIVTGVTTKPKFKRGQVVFIDTDYYKTKNHRGEQFQKITRVWRWLPAHPGDPTWQANPRGPTWGYNFANGDEANEKWLKPLTKQQIGA